MNRDGEAVVTLCGFDGFYRALHQCIHQSEVGFVAIGVLESPGWLTRVSEVLKSHPENFEFLRESYALR